MRKRFNAKPLIAMVLAMLAIFSQASTAFASTMADFVPEDLSESTIICFVSTACASCFRVEEFLETLDDEYALENGGTTRVSINIININEGDSSVLIQEFFDAYGVTSTDRHTPIVFYASGYLYDDVVIKQNLVRVIQSGAAQRFQERTSTSVMQQTGIPFLAGLLGGLNPCSISLALLLLTLVANKRDKTLKVGFTYVASKVVTYLALGIFLYSFVSALDSTAFRAVTLVTKWVSILLALGLCLFNVLDYFSAKSENYGKIRLQLPKKLRAWNNDLVKKAAGHDKLMILGVFFIGIIVSAGEFLCTGQVYLATILYVVKSAPGDMGALMSFVSYVEGMAIPMSLIVIVCAFGKRVLDVSEVARKNLPYIKLANAVLFLAFAGYMLFSK